MEDREEYKFISDNWYQFNPSGNWRPYTPPRGTFTFTVTTPDNDRLPIKASYCEVEDGCLVFQDEDRETVKAFAFGHWVKVEREDEQA